MKAKIEIRGEVGCWFARIEIVHNLIIGEYSTIETTTHKSKGQLKRKTIQFCSQLNLEMEFV